MTRALIYSFAACIVSVALEGVFAGSGIKRRLAELRLPRFTPHYGVGSSSAFVTT